jgi:hypothetical protein
MDDDSGATIVANQVADQQVFDSSASMVSISVVAGVVPISRSILESPEPALYNVTD